MRIKHKVNVVVSDDTLGEDCLFGPADDKAEVTLDQFTEHESGKFSIAASGSATLSLGTVGTVGGLYIRALGDFDLTLNGTEELLIRKAPSALSTVPVKFFMEGTITSILVENPSATTALVGYYVVWGDAA